MKLYYDPISKEVFYAVYSTDIIKFKNTTNIPLSEYNIDEVIPDNVELCRDLYATEWKFNNLKQRKYYIESNLLYSRDGWEEWHL